MADTKACRICLDAAVEEGDVLIAPCKCTGSHERVHVSCLLKWVHKATAPKGDAALTCGTCLGRYFGTPLAEVATTSNSDDADRQLRRRVENVMSLSLLITVLIGVAMLLIFTVLSATGVDDLKFMQHPDVALMVLFLGFYFLAAVAVLGIDWSVIGLGSCHNSNWDRLCAGVLATLWYLLKLFFAVYWLLTVFHSHVPVYIPVVLTVWAFAMTFVTWVVNRGGRVFLPPVPPPPMPPPGGVLLAVGADEEQGEGAEQ